MMERKDYTNGLRELADWWDKHLEVPLNYAPSIATGALNTKEEAALVIRALGNCTKRYSGDIFVVGRKFGPIDMEFLFYRDKVCERRVVSVELIPEQFIEAHTIPARTKEIVEWDCHPILSAAEARDGTS
jgi:hypothetical protein